MAPGQSARIELRQADGSSCPAEGCLTPVTIVDNDGPAVERIVISPVPPAASADHGPYYAKDDFLALPDGAVHGQGAHTDLHAQYRHRGHRHRLARAGARHLRPRAPGALHWRFGHAAAHLHLDPSPRATTIRTGWSSSPSTSTAARSGTGKATTWRRRPSRRSALPSTGCAAGSSPCGSKRPARRARASPSRSA